MYKTALFRFQTHVIIIFIMYTVSKVRFKLILRGIYMKGLKDPEMRPTHTIQLTELLQFSNEVKSFKKGAYIFQEGMLAKNMYLILSGKVKVSKSTADGRELTLRLCSENDIVGEAVFF